MAKLVVVGCSTASLAGSSSVAVDDLPASSIPVLQFGECRGLVVFFVGIDVMYVLKASQYQCVGLKCTVDI